MTVFCYNFWRPVTAKTLSTARIIIKKSWKIIKKSPLKIWHWILQWFFGFQLQKHGASSYALGELIKTCHQQMDLRCTENYQQASELQPDPTGFPIGSRCGIFTYIWLIFMVNVGKYTIHGWYGDENVKKAVKQCLRKILSKNLESNRRDLPSFHRCFLSQNDDIWLVVSTPSEKYESNWVHLPQFSGWN